MNNLKEFIVYEPPFTKVRIGPKRDGGYIVCWLNGMYDTFISGGIGNDIEFEQHLLYFLPQLSCLAFDGTIPYPPYSVERLSFIKMKLGEINDATTTNLSPFMCGIKNAFVKIDIEGHEFKLIPSMIANGDINKIKQLVLEIHTPEDIRLHPEYYGQSLSSVTNDFMFKMMNEINRTHRLIHVHGNSAVGSYIQDDIIFPKVIECTFLRKSDFPTFDWVQSKEPIPCELDFPNTLNSTEIVLNGFPWNIKSCDNQ